MQNKKWLSILLALAVSIGLWVYVVTVENPVKELELNNIPVTFTGEDLLRTDYSLLITESNADGGVSLTFSGKFSDLRKIQENKSELFVSISVSHLRSAKTYDLSYDMMDIVLPASVSAQDITLTEKSVGKIKVTLEKLGKYPVPVKVQNNVETEEGYTTGRVTQSHEQIFVEGPEEIVRQISYAQVILERENADQSISSTLPFTLIDNNGEIVENDRVSCDVTEIEVSLPVLMYKDVPVVAPVIEGGGATADDCDIEITPKTVRLSGEPAVLETINSIQLSNISLGNLMSNNEVVEREIVIPEGCTSISGEQDAEVSISIKNKVIRQLRVRSSNFQHTGVPLDMQVKYNTVSLSVTIRANEKDADLITEENLRVVADFTTGTLGANMNNVPVTIYVTGFDGAGPIGTYTISADVVVADTNTDNEG